MAAYRYLAYDLLSNVALGELPLSIRKFGEVLNGAGEFNAQAPIDADTASLLMAATVPERTIVYIERDGTLVGGGFIIWRRIRRGNDMPMTLWGAGVSSIWRRNRIVANLTYTALDQFTIARNLVTHLQSQAGGNIGISVGSGTSGVLRDRTYYGYERKNLGDALSELAAVDNGFDFAVECSMVAGAPVKNLVLSYPRRGRIAGSTGIIFETGKNIVNYEFEEDGTRSARAIDALGSGDGADMKISTAVDTALIDAGYPLTAEVISHKDVTVQATINAHALAAMRARSATPTFLTVTVDPNDIDAGLGTWIVGDDALVRITDSNFPRRSDGSPGHESYYRILAYSVDIPDDGPETVTLVLGSIN
jgi:hypothetical protein